MANIEIQIDDDIQKYDFDEITDGYPVLDVNTDELGIIHPDYIDEVEKEVERMDKFTPYMSCLLKQETDKEIEKNRIFRTHAVLLTYKEFLDAVDDDVASDNIVNNLENIIKEKEEKLRTDQAFYESVIAEGHNISNNVHSEFIRVRGKDAVAGVRMVRVRSEKIKNHNRWFNRKQVKQQIFKENRENNKKVDNNVIKTAEYNFFKKEIWKEGGGLVDSIEDFNKSCNNEFFTDNAVIDSNVSAQFLRYSTEAVADSKAVLNKDNVDLKIGAKATANFSAAAAQGVFKVQVPDENGFGIMQFLKKEAPAFVDDDFTEVFFKVILQTSGNAFVGACASVSTDLGLKCSRGERPEAVAQAGVELFAGAKVQADATFAVDTMFVDDEKMDDMRAATQTVGERGDKIVSAKDIEDKKIAKWERLGELSAGAYLAFGAGVEASFMFGYDKGHFRFQANIGATVKLGAGSFLNGKIAPVLVGKFVLTIANGFNWKGISDKLDEKVHLLYHSILSNCFYLNEKVEVVYGQFLNHIDKVMNIIKNLDGFEGHDLKILKIVDDDLDKKLPGYTSFKQYNMGFIILRGAYNIYKDINTKNRAIYLVLKAKNDKTRWNYATWQMKVNLIYDMRKGISDYVDDYSDEQRGEAVLTVLKSARNKDELDKIIEGLYKPGLGRERIDVTDLMTEEQKISYKALVL